jgi:hypothetical protein
MKPTNAKRSTQRKKKKPAKRRSPTTFDQRSDEWRKVYFGFVAATRAYAHHPETPDAVAAPLLDALANLRKRLDEEDWIPEEL